MSEVKVTALPTMGRARRSITASQEERVVFTPLLEGHTLPLLCRPRFAGTAVAACALRAGA